MLKIKMFVTNDFMELCYLLWESYRKYFSPQKNLWMHGDRRL